MRWPRRNTLPREVRTRLDLQRGERVLAHATSSSGVLVATTRALHLPDGHAAPWEHIDRARWTEDGLVFVEEGVGERSYAVEEPGPLAETVFERVSATIVVSQRVALNDDGTGVNLVARRPAGGDAITWQAHLDAGIDPEDPSVNARVSTALARLREQVGV